MALKLACVETGMKCSFEAVAATKEELMQHVGVHVNMAHPEMAKDPPPPEMIARLIREV